MTKNEALELYNECVETIKKSDYKNYLNIRQMRHDLLGNVYKLKPNQRIDSKELCEFPTTIEFIESNRFCGIYCKSTNTIEINTQLLNNPSKLKNTMIHELAHFIIENSYEFIIDERPFKCELYIRHKKSWQQLASYFSWLFDTNIKTYCDSGILDVNKRKYLLKCDCCGEIVGRDRMSDFVKHPERYRCCVCNKGHFKLIK